MEYFQIHVLEFFKGIKFGLSQVLQFGIYVWQYYYVEKD
jgi:hypothetical protein